MPSIVTPRKPQSPPVASGQPSQGQPSAQGQPSQGQPSAQGKPSSQGESSSQGQSSTSLRALALNPEKRTAEKRGPQRRKIGRPKQTEVKEVRQTALFTPSEWEAVQAIVPQGKQPGPWLREMALEHAKAGRNAVLVDKAMSGTENVRLRFLTKAPCGPWSEAVEHAGEFVLSEHIADELQVRPNDVLVRAVGESMEGAGILDGALVVMRPLPEHRVPRNGEIALVEVTREDGETFGTIKHWHSGGPGQPPRLTDGEGEEFPLPDLVTSVRPVAVADGVIARL